MVSRRDFLRGTLAAGLSLFLHSRMPHLGARHAFANTARLLAIPGGSLVPGLIPKYQMPLIIPPAMPRTSKIVHRGGKNIDYYEIAVRQFQQQILPAGMPATTV